jgi:triosephosphate isomerase
MSDPLDRLYLGTNTKMFKTPSEAREHISRLRELIADIPRDVLELFVIPSYTSLHLAVPAAGDRISIGAQNIGWEERGQYTGEISPLMLQELGVSFVMVGHSERRHILHETDFEEEKKVSCAMAHGFRTLLCVGETAQQKEYGLTMEAIAAQLKIGLHSITPQQAAQYLWVAYEPVWAIGTAGVPASADYAEQIHAGIKSVLRALLGETIGLSIPVLYGGSVNSQNAPELIGRDHIDGLFIGRSAWDADQFHAIIRTVLPLFQERKSRTPRESCG